MRTLTVIILSLFLFACSKEKQTNRRLIGKWHLTDVLEQVYSNSILVSSTNYPMQNALLSKYEFGEDGIVWVTTSLPGQLAMIVGQYYVVENNKIIFYEDLTTQNSQKYMIKKLTKKEMELQTMIELANETVDRRMLFTRLN